jgi:putative peptidoglycan lipid II flippase
MVAAASSNVAGRETPSAGRRIAGATTILLVGVVASRLTALLRDAILVPQFLSSGQLDPYLAAFRLPDLIFNLVAGGALGSALIPIFAEYRAGGPAGALTRLATTTCNAVAGAAILAAAAGILAAPAVVPLLGAGFQPDQQAQMVVLVRVLLLQPIFFGAGEEVMRYLNTHGHFVFPAVAPAVYNLAIITAAVFLGPQLGTVGVAIGVVAGALLYLLVQLPAAYVRGFRWRPELDRHHPGLRRIVPLMLPRLIGQGAVQLSFLITTFLATHLPAGQLAALTVGWTLMMLPLGTFAMSAAGAAFPVLADQAARREHHLMATTVRRTLSGISFLMIPSALGLLLVGRPLVETLYLRQDFTPQSAALIASALAVFALGLPAHGAIEVIPRAFYALQDTRTPVTLGVLGMAFNVLLAIVLVGPFQHLGIAAAMSISATVEAFALLAVLHRRLPDLLTRSLLGSLGLSCLAGLAMSIIAGLTLMASRTTFGLPPVLQLILAVASGGLTYGAIALLFRSPEVGQLSALMRRRRRPIGSA